MNYISNRSKRRGLSTEADPQTIITDSWLRIRVGESVWDYGDFDPSSEEVGVPQRKYMAVKMKGGKKGIIEIEKESAVPEEKLNPVSKALLEFARRVEYESNAG